MPREITPEPFTVYQLDELEPAAREDAIWNVRHLLAGSWWDEGDNEQVGDAIVYRLADALQTPGWDRYGEADFPGIDGVELVAWNFEHGESLALRGKLTPANAPALPWGTGTEEIFKVHLEPTLGGHTYVGCAIQDNEGEDPPGPVRAMQDAVAEAMFAAKRAGLAQLEYLGSAQRAEDDILANEREFTAEGRLYHG